MRQAGSNTNAATFWRELFSNWPEQRPRRGLIISAWLEHIPFEDYLISEAVLFLSRSQPDGLNARKVMIPFEQIVAVKFPDVFELDAFAAAGFGRTLTPKNGGIGVADEPVGECGDAGAVEQVGLAGLDHRHVEQADVNVVTSLAESVAPPLDELTGLQSHVVAGSRANDTDAASEDCAAAPFSGADSLPLNSHVDCLGAGVALADDVERHAEVVGPRGARLVATSDASKDREPLER